MRDIVTKGREKICYNNLKMINELEAVEGQLLKLQNDLRLWFLALVTFIRQ